jgi:ABC-type spermidine/putrescine transport system permease subunit II
MSLVGLGLVCGLVGVMLRFVVGRYKQHDVASLEEIIILPLLKPAMVTSVSVTNLHESITMEL